MLKSDWCTILHCVMMSVWVVFICFGCSKKIFLTFFYATNNCCVTMIVKFSSQTLRLVRVLRGCVSDFCKRRSPFLIEIVIVDRKTDGRLMSIWSQESQLSARLLGKIIQKIMLVHSRAGWSAQLSKKSRCAFLDVAPWRP